MTKEYTNGEITVVWQPEKCIHSKICIQMLPKVYRPNERPWIQIENGTTAALQEQVKKCPSGALTYYMNGGEKEERPESTANTQVEVLRDGPLLVYGTLEVKNIDGSTETKTKTTAFCRCGASSHKPYCDGSHKEVGFKED